MPRHLISDVHEWINEIPTVPIYYLVKHLTFCETLPVGYQCLKTVLSKWLFEVQVIV